MQCVPSGIIIRVEKIDLDFGWKTTVIISGSFLDPKMMCESVILRCSLVTFVKQKTKNEKMVINWNKINKKKM